MKPGIGQLRGSCRSIITVLCHLLLGGTTVMMGADKEPGALSDVMAPATGSEVPSQINRTLDLRVGDAGDGPSCDHADWADATITLRSGRTLRLDDLTQARATLGRRTPGFAS